MNYSVQPSKTPPSNSKFFADANNEIEASLLHLAVETTELQLIMCAVPSPEKNIIRFYVNSNSELNKVKTTFDHLQQLMKINKDFKSHLQPLIDYNKSNFQMMQAYNVN